MKRITIALALMLTTAAYAENLPPRGMTSQCWKWISEGAYHEWTCKGNAAAGLEADIVARQGFVNNNRGRTYQTEGRTTGPDGTTTSTSTTTVFPRWY